VVEGELVAMPAFADAMFLYYRRDLLEKHGQPLARTWDELAASARVVQRLEAAAGGAALQGLSIQGAPIEGAVCTFLMPYWGQGKAFNDARGRLTLDRPAAVRGLDVAVMMDSGVIKRNAAEVRSQDTMNEFKAGQVLFAIHWSVAWDRFQNDADSKVKGRVGVMRPRAALPTTARRWNSCAATSRVQRWPTNACKPTSPGKSCSSSRRPGVTAPRTW